MARISAHHIPPGEYHGVVIVGAGIAGLSAAWVLADRGVSPLVLEQAAQVGGRCATVRHETGVFDVGAQFVVKRRPDFAPVMDFWLAHGQAREWTRAFPELHGVSELASHPRYCGTTGMQGLAESLAAKTQVRTNARVKRIREARGCWLVDVEGADRIRADMVLLAAPLPQMLRLISDENTWRMGALLLPLAGVEYAPSLALAVVLDGPSGLPAPGAARVDHPVIAWMADNHMKGISPDVSAVTIHATRAFSRTHWETPPEDVTALLLESAAPMLKGAITAQQLVVWEYGAPENTLLSSHYRVEGRAPLFFAGDAFCGGLVEGAALSGMAAAKAIAERLELGRRTR